MVTLSDEESRKQYGDPAIIGGIWYGFWLPDNGTVQYWLRAAASWFMNGINPDDPADYQCLDCHLIVRKSELGENHPYGGWFHVNCRKGMGHVLGYHGFRLISKAQALAEIFGKEATE